MWRDSTFECETREVEAGDSLMLVAAADSGPAAEGGVGGPVGVKNTARISDVSFEG